MGLYSEDYFLSTPQIWDKKTIYEWTLNRYHGHPITPQTAPGFGNGFGR